MKKKGAKKPKPRGPIRPDKAMAMGKKKAC
jgi:hypothetical protein